MKLSRWLRRPLSSRERGLSAFASSCLLLMLSSCDRAPNPPFVSGLLQVDTTQVVQLSAALERDTIRVGDTLPVYVTLALKAGVGGVVADLSSELFFAGVLNLDGSIAEVDSGAEGARSTWEETFAPISALGAHIERRDLRCVGRAMFSSPPSRRGKRGCIMRFSLRTPGRYKVVALYTATWRTGKRSLLGVAVQPCPVSLPQPRDRGTRTDPDSIFPCYVNGRTLADTIDLTIVP